MEVIDAEYVMGHCSSSKMVGELMEVMDDECKDEAGKKHCSSSKMVGKLMEVMNGECGYVLNLERGRSIAAAERWWVTCWRGVDGGDGW